MRITMSVSDLVQLGDDELVELASHITGFPVSMIREVKIPDKVTGILLVRFRPMRIAPSLCRDGMVVIENENAIEPGAN